MTKTELDFVLTPHPEGSQELNFKPKEGVEIYVLPIPAKKVGSSDHSQDVQGSQSEELALKLKVPNEHRHDLLHHIDDLRSALYVRGYNMRYARPKNQRTIGDNIRRFNPRRS